MGNKEIKKLFVAAVAMITACSWASPWTLPVKVAVKKAGARAGEHAVGEVTVRGGTALAAATARHEAAKTAGTVIKKATPGKILAVGGATAMVAGAHEMADGVQSIGEGVGEAIKNDPGAAEAVARTFLAVPKTLITLVCVFALFILGWLFWPFLALARNWVRLMAARRARALIPVESAPNKAVQKTGDGGGVRIGVVWAIVGFLLLTALGVWRFAADGNVPVERPSKVQMGKETEGGGDVVSRAARRAKSVAEFRRNYEASVDRIRRDFHAELDSKARTEFGRVRARIPGVVEKFGTMSRCVSLVKAIALDKGKGGIRTEENVRQDLETSFYSGLYTARDNVAECLQRLSANLANARRLLSVQLEGELASAELPGDDAYKALLEECGERIEKSKRDLASGQIEAGIAVAIEAVCIRQTVAVISSLLGKAAARQAGTMVAGVGAAAADGPLPVCDIVVGVSVIGCTAWTAWDVYKAKKVLPARLGYVLENATRECERVCRDEVKEAGEKILRSHVL